MADPAQKLGTEQGMNFHRDAYSLLIAMLLLAGAITLLLAVVNPIR